MSKKDELRSERVKVIIRAIIETVNRPDWELMDTWIAYRILSLQIENSIAGEIDEYIREAWHQK